MSYDDQARGILEVAKVAATPLGMVVRREPDTITLDSSTIRAILGAEIERQTGRSMSHISAVATYEATALGEAGPRHIVTLTITLKPETK